MTQSFEAALYSHVGMKRKQNQDSAGINENLGLFILADGMGGHQGGEIASALCVEKITECFNASTGINTAHFLQQSLQHANQAIHLRSQNEPSLKGMGTTATVLKLGDDGIAHIAQVGDSRAYYWNSQGIWQLTQDHSLVQEKLRAGLITRDQMKTDDMKNVITRSVGYETNLKVDLYSFPMQSGDGFLLCSDGLSNPVSEALMFDILDESLKSGLHLEDIAKRLIEAANQRGGDDNVTVVLVQIK
jgi:serine/threonine protein phosphatase PrpC